MKLIGVVGSNKSGQEGLKAALSLELGYDKYSVKDILEEQLLYSNDEFVVGQLDHMITALAKDTGIVETTLIAKIFENAAVGRWGLVITDILEKKTVDLITHLGGKIVFVGNDDDSKNRLRVDTDDDVDFSILDSNGLKAEIRSNLLDIPRFLEGFNKLSVSEAVVVHQRVVQDLTASGFDVLAKVGD